MRTIVNITVSVGVSSKPSGCTSGFDYFRHTVSVPVLFLITPYGLRGYIVRKRRISNGHARLLRRIVYTRVVCKRLCIRSVEDSINYCVRRGVNTYISKISIAFVWTERNRICVCACVHNKTRALLCVNYTDVEAHTRSLTYKICIRKYGRTYLCVVRLHIINI